LLQNTQHRIHKTDSTTAALGTKQHIAVPEQNSQIEGILGFLLLRFGDAVFVEQPVVRAKSIEIRNIHERSMQSTFRNFLEGEDAIEVAM